jgi:hypothetical protein
MLAGANSKGQTGIQGNLGLVCIVDPSCRTEKGCILRIIGTLASQDDKVQPMKLKKLSRAKMLTALTFADGKCRVGGTT